MLLEGLLEACASKLTHSRRTCFLSGACAFPPERRRGLPATVSDNCAPVAVSTAAAAHTSAPAIAGAATASGVSAAAGAAAAPDALETAARREAKRAPAEAIACAHAYAAERRAQKACGAEVQRRFTGGFRNAASELSVFSLPTENTRACDLNETQAQTTHLVLCCILCRGISVLRQCGSEAARQVQRFGS